MPAFNEEILIASSIRSVPVWVDRLIVVDDGSTDATFLAANRTIPTSGEVIQTTGLGVGGALAAGYSHLIEWIDDNKLDDEEWVAVVMAGDCQMNPADIDSLLAPLSRVPYVKGDRFSHPNGLGEMPKSRKVGSRLLATLTSLACGRVVSDPQCGFTAVRVDALRDWKWVREWHGYGYPNWWLLNMSCASIPFESVPVHSVYKDEKSGIVIPKFFFTVSMMLLSGLWRRGWNWYVRGRGGTPFHRRFSVSLCWFTSLATVVALPLIHSVATSLSIPVIGLFAVLSLTWYLDQQEVQKRMEENWNLESSS